MRADSSAKFDEMSTGDGAVRGAYRDYQEWLNEQQPGWLRQQSEEAERFFRRTGITFNVYGEAAGTERIFPFDLIPRIVPSHEWVRIERGLKQRIRALNLFIDDIYHDQKIIKDGVIPADVVKTAEGNILSIL